MGRFIVNPPIKDDANYYREDDVVVRRILSGDSMLAPGLRRSGKTSFLYKVQRAAQAAGHQTRFFDLPDFYAAGRLDAEVKEAVREIEGAGNAVILLDEAEAFKSDQAHLAALLNACRGRTVVLTCAPVFVLELDQYSDWIQRFVEPLNRHLLGPLSWDESVALLTQSKHPKPSPLDADSIERVRQKGDRMPIVLQALGSKYGENFDLSVSLAGLGMRILRGLTERAREALIYAAHGGSVAYNSAEVRLLTALGAMRREGDLEASIVGQTLRSVIRESSEPPAAATSSAATSPDADTPPTEAPTGAWETHACILHLSDLHFGPHCIEKGAEAALQFERLQAALEKDGVAPDFVVVTGDLSWSGHRDELKEAERFLESLTKWLARSRGWREQQTRRRILLIPGNHEAAWSLSNGLNEQEAPVWSSYSLAPFANFVYRFHRGKEFWDLECPCHDRCFKEPSLAFILISTSHLITQQQKRGQFGDPLRREVARLLDKEEVKKARFRVGLMHHNLRSAHRDGQVMLDAEGAFVHFGKYKPGMDIILHGHVHQGEVGFFAPREGATIQYSAVGSFGVRADHRPGDDVRGRISNEFSVVYLETNGTGRRFTTQFYQLSYTITGDWEWQAGRRVSSRNL